MSPVSPPFRQRRPRLALATYAELPLLSDAERPLVPALVRQGVEAEPVVWSDAKIDWRAYDGVVLRSCWDYHLRVGEFRRWLDGLAARGIAVWNPPSVVRWNLDKRYLADLDAIGVDVVRTIWLARGTTPDVNAILRVARWPRLVVKPTVSASGHETWMAAPPLSSAELGRVRDMLASAGVMVQPLVEEVVRDGELSLVFLDGRFSHAVRKRASSGEFRVQNQFGGSAERIDPPPGIVRSAARILATVPMPLLYARVDGVVASGRFVLMELEVAEPSLFLELAENSFDRLAHVIRSRLIGAAATGGRES